MQTSFKLSKDIFTTDSPLLPEERIELWRRKSWVEPKLDRKIWFTPKHLEKFKNVLSLKRIPEFLKRQAE